jgi:hypothetical protein
MIDTGAGGRATQRATPRSRTRARTVTLSAGYVVLWVIMGCTGVMGLVFYSVQLANFHLLVFYHQEEKRACARGAALSASP